MLINFDLDSNFWNDEELALLFKEEYDTKVSSKIMWALLLYTHPKSKFKDLDLKSKEKIIKTDYLNNTEFSFQDYETTLEKIKQYLLTPPKRMLVTWDAKIQEIQQLLDKTPVTIENYDAVSKMMKDLAPMMKQYKEVYKMFQEEEEIATHGNVEESLSEKGLM